MKILGIICICIVGAYCQSQTTVQRLIADGNFTTLVKYVTKAGLVDTLDGGTFTIFAPTDKAFSHLDKATRTALENDNSLLKDALLYHVISGNIPSSAASNELKLTMANGKQARMNIYSHNNHTKVTIQGNVISRFDLTATNGVIHVLKSVMVAQPTGDLVDYVAGNANLSALFSLVKQANLANALKTGDNFTFFAPTNEAFGLLDQAKVAEITGNPAKLDAVLKYHVLGSTKFSVGLYQRERLRTLNTNDDLIVHLANHHHYILIDNADVTKGDIGVTNGVVHIVDHVIIPDKDPLIVG